MNKAPINLLSPIGLMPFGPYKGTLIWQLPIDTITWIKRQECTPETLQTLEDAWDMFMHEGQYAVLRIIPDHGRVLVDIYTDCSQAYNLAYNTPDLFVYFISTKKHEEAV